MTMNSVRQCTEMDIIETLQARLPYLHNHSSLARRGYGVTIDRVDADSGSCVSFSARTRDGMTITYDERDRCACSCEGTGHKSPCDHMTDIENEVELLRMEVSHSLLTESNDPTTCSSWYSWKHSSTACLQRCRSERSSWWRVCETD